MAFFLHHIPLDQEEIEIQRTSTLKLSNQIFLSLYLNGSIFQVKGKLYKMAMENFLNEHLCNELQMKEMGVSLCIVIQFLRFFIPLFLALALT